MKVKLGDAEELVPSPPRSHVFVAACALVLVNCTVSGAVPTVGDAVNEAVNGDSVTCCASESVPQALVAVAT